ncbi:MAG: HTH-type transcriptional regulator KipR [Firmicutes bacterium]|nr:HTH-type transcriptional regulator KipR [candidate division NPL-UPA2 bacterium]
MAIANTFDKGLKILELFTLEKPRMTLRDVAERSGLTKPTALRMLNTLEANGYLMRDRSKAYCLGLRFLELANAVTERLDIRHAALVHMDELLLKVDQAVNLVIRDGLEGVYIEKRETSHPVRVYTRIGRRAPLYAGACPRALIAFLPDKELQELLPKFVFAQHTASTPKSSEDLLERIKRERALGYCFSQGELYEGTSAIAMPVRDHTRKVVGAVSLAGPSASFNDEKLDYMIKHLSRCAEGISREMGYQVRKEM